jgi:hypothetical protein
MVLTERIELVGDLGGARTVLDFSDVAGGIEAVEEAAAGVSREQSGGSEGVAGGDGSAAVEFTHRNRAVIEEVGGRAAVLLPGARALGGVACRPTAADAAQAVFRIEGEAAARIGRGVAVAIVDIAAGRVLIIAVEVLNDAYIGGGVACAVIAKPVGVTPIPGRLLLGQLILGRIGIVRNCIERVITWSIDAALVLSWRHRCRSHYS